MNQSVLAKNLKSEYQSQTTGIRGTSTKELFDLGIKCVSNQATRQDLVEAHKWFNLAAMLGNGQAIDARQEMADQMTKQEISMAQRKAREWVLHDKT